MKRIFTFILGFGLLWNISSNAQINQEKVPDVTVSAINCETIAVEKDTKGTDTLYKNDISSNMGFGSSKYLSAHADSQAVILADDFSVPVGEEWDITTVQLYMYWVGDSAADYYAIHIWNNSASDLPDTTMYSYYFTAGLPNPLSLYNMPIDVSTENISLTEGTYWVSALGIYIEEPSDGSFLTYWNRDTLDPVLGDFACQMRDSVGLYYPDPPTDWRSVHYTDQPFNSLRFRLIGSSSSGTGTQQIEFENNALIAYPNPAANQITFINRSDRAQYIDIYDNQGRILETIQIKESEVIHNIESYTSGIYFYRLLGKNNEIINTGKFTVL